MKTLEQIKVEAAVEALAANGFNQVKAAKALGISRGTLRTLVSQYMGTNLKKEVMISKYLIFNKDTNSYEGSYSDFCNSIFGPNNPTESSL